MVVLDLSFAVSLVIMRRINATYMQKMCTLFPGNRKTELVESLWRLKDLLKF